MYYISRFIYWCLFKIFFRFQVIDSENEIIEDRLIIASNHLSNLDPPVLAAALKQEIHFLGKSELFKNPVLGWYIRQHNTHPIKRGKGDSGAIKQCIRIIQDGHALVVFPQGTRGGNWENAGDGAAFLARKTGAKVLPMKITGSDIILPPGRILPGLFTGLSVKIGTALQIGASEDIKTFTQRLSDAIQNL